MNPRARHLSSEIRTIAQLVAWAGLLVVVLGADSLSQSIVIEPDSVAFGSVRVDSTRTETVTVSNNHAVSTLVIDTVTSPILEFEVYPPGVYPISIPPGSSADFDIRYVPSDTVSDKRKLTFDHNFGIGFSNVIVTGVGLQGYFASDTIITYGGVEVDSSAVELATVRNVGNDTLIISNAEVGGAFTINKTGATILPGDSVDFEITFTPPAVGNFEEDAVFTHDGDGGTSVVVVKGRGVQALFSAEGYDFGPVTVGSTAESFVTVTNNGSSVLLIDSVVSRNPLFEVMSDTASIGPDGGMAQFAVSYTPVDTGMHAGQIVFYHNAAPGTVDSVMVTGRGVQAVFSAEGHDFGPVVVGSTAESFVTVTNNGSSVLLIDSVVSRNSLFEVMSDTASIGPNGGTAQFAVRYAPVDTGMHAGQIVFYHNAAPGMVDSVMVTGRGVQAVFSAEGHDFGPVVVGSTAESFVTVTNNGSSVLLIDSVLSRNPLFEVMSDTASIGPDGGMAQFAVRYAPVDTGMHAGQIVFYHSAIPGTVDSVVVTGRGVQAVFSAEGHDFGPVAVGSTAESFVTVTNNGSSALLIDSVVSRNPMFEVTRDTASIGPDGGTAQFAVSYTPLDTGMHAGQIVFYHNAAPGTVDSVMVSGMGVIAVFSAEGYDFGPVVVGSTAESFVTVTNNGSSVLLIDSVVSRNPLFEVMSDTASIGPDGDTAQFAVSYTPLDTGMHAGQIVFYHSAIPGTVDSVMVTGRGVQAVFSAEGYNFGPVVVDSTVESFVTVTNSGSAVLLIDSVVSRNPLFEVTRDTASIGPDGGTAQFAVSYTPVDTGMHAGQIVFYHNAAPGTVDSVMVSGMGVMASIATSVDTVHFPTILVGEDSVRLITVENIGSSLLLVDSITSSSEVFSVTPEGATIDVGDTMTFEVHFTPGSIDFFDAFISFHHNTPGSPKIIRAFGSATKTVRPGDTDGNEVVGVSDIVNIGLCYGENGPSREGIPDSVEQLLPIGWGQEICARADCNGDSTVNADDVIVIVENFGRESWTGSPPKKRQTPGLSKTAIVNQLLEAADQMTEGKARDEILARLLHYKYETLGIPREWSLAQNYPNPFNAETIIRAGVPERAARVKLSIYDLLGRLVRVLEAYEVEEGWHEFRWDGTGNQGTKMASGAYFYRLETPWLSPVKKIIHLR
jgi:hypothetical protein